MVFVPHHKASNPTVMVAFSTIDPNGVSRNTANLTRRGGKVPTV